MRFSEQNGIRASISFDTSGSTVQFQVLRTASAVNNLTGYGWFHRNWRSLALGARTGTFGGTIPIFIIAPKSTGVLALGGTTVANSAMAGHAGCQQCRLSVGDGFGNGDAGSRLASARGWVRIPIVLFNLGPKGSWAISISHPRPALQRTSLPRKRPLQP